MTVIYFGVIERGKKESMKIGKLGNFMMKTNILNVIYGPKWKKKIILCYYL